jgi:hypothetical protein
VYTVQFRYLEKYATLTNDSDTNDFTDNAEDLLVAHVLARLTSEDKQDSTLGAYYEELRRDELRTLRERTDSLMGAGYLRSESVLDDYYIWLSPKFTSF